MKVFLGGTVNGSNWREYVIPRLNIDYFNPVVSVWNDEAYEEQVALAILDNKGGLVTGPAGTGKSVILKNCEHS